MNGALARTTVTSGNMPITAGVLRLGGNNKWNEWFSGLIDEVRIYDRALSQTELEAAMATPLETGPASRRALRPVSWRPGRWRRFT